MTQFVLTKTPGAKMKKSLLIVVILFIATMLFAGDESLQLQKDEIWDMAKMYKQENENRALRLPPAPKAKITSITHRTGNRTKSKIVLQTQITQPAAAVIAKPNVYNFATTTAWGTSKVEVIEYPDKPYFDVTFDSENPVQGLVIRDSSRKMDVYTCYLNDIKTPDAPIRINYAYSPTYIMILKTNVNDEIQPQIIALYKKDVVKTAQ
jgi:hypothetical protein